MRATGLATLNGVRRVCHGPERYSTSSQVRVPRPVQLRPRRASRVRRTTDPYVTTMFRNTYDSDNTVFSPQGRLHQVEYALEAVKQGSAVVGLRSKTHAVLVALKRAPSELASHQKKMLRIDNHIGMGFAGLTSDARVLSNYMRQLCLSSRLLYSRPLPVSRLISSLSDRAQLNTMQYGKRPYGVGFLVIGVDGQGPHLYEFSPTGNCFEYFAMALGARSQSAKTYLEHHYEEFADLTLDQLIVQGLTALRDSLQQGKELELEAVSLAVVGPRADADADSPESKGAEKFRVVEGEPLKKWLDQLEKRKGPQTQTSSTVAESSSDAAAGGDATVEDVQPMEE